MFVLFQPEKEGDMKNEIERWMYEFDTTLAVNREDCARLGELIRDKVSLIYCPIPDETAYRCHYLSLDLPPLRGADRNLV